MTSGYDLRPPERCALFYPQFRIDAYGLIEAGILEHIGYDRFNWTRTKTSLAEYFNWIGSLTSGVPGGFWNPVESCFTVKQKPLIRGSLTRLLSKQKTFAPAPESPDFTEIKKIITEYRFRYEEHKAEKAEEKEIVCRFNISLNRISEAIEKYNDRLVQEQKTIEAVYETCMEILDALSPITGGGKKTDAKETNKTKRKEIKTLNL